MVSGFDFTKFQVMQIFLLSTDDPVTVCLAGGTVVASGRRD